MKRPSKFALSAALLVAFAGILLFATASAFGSAVIIGAAGLDTAAAPPDIAKPDPKCIDMSGIDQALEELMMLLRGAEVKGATSDLAKFEKYSALSYSVDPLESQMHGMDAKLIEPAKNLASLFENGRTLKLRKVLVSRDYTEAYYDDPQVFTFTEDGKLIFAESNSREISILDGDGAKVASFGGRGAGEGQFDKPSCIVTDRNGRIYVSDRGRGDIQVFDTTGAYKGALATGLSEPVGMAIFESIQLFVLERKSATVRVFNLSTMKEERSFGGEGAAPGKFLRPSGISLDKLGSLIVADAGNDRIQVLDRRGKVEQVWNGIKYPQAVAVGPSNQVFVLADTIKRFNSSGKLTGEWSRAIKFEDGGQYYLGNGIYPELRNLLLINDPLYANILVYEQE